MNTAKLKLAAAALLALALLSLIIGHRSSAEPVNTGLVTLPADLAIELTQPDYLGAIPSQYAKSNGVVYFGALTSTGIDLATFRVLKGKLKPSIYGGEPVYVYAADSEHVYHQGTEMRGADPATFQPIENGRYVHSYGRDKDGVFYRYLEIKDADPATFEILWKTVPEGCGAPHYSRDEGHVFFEEKAVVGADPKTFKIVGDRHAVDAAHVFFEAELEEGVSPVDFVPPVFCEYG